MWIFTKDGFFSAVEHFKDAGFIHVRSRWKEDLEKLESYLSVSRCEQSFNYHPRDEHKAPWNNPDLNLNVQYTPDADYPYRMDVSRELWEQYLKQAVVDIDYTNFKNRIYEIEGSSDRLDMYHGVWALLRGEE